MNKLFLQDAPHEGAAACLATVLHGFGLYVTPLDLAEDLGSSRVGATREALEKNAIRFGLRPETLTCDAGRLEEFSGPLIAWIEGDREEELERPVVIFGIRGQRVRLGDPALGKYKLSKDQFKTRFRGRVMTFRAGPDFRAGRSAPTYLARFWAFLAEYRRKIFLSLALGLAASGLSLAVIFLGKVFVDRVLPLEKSEALFAFLGVYFLARLLNMFGASLSQLVTTLIRNGATRTLSERFFLHSLRLEKKHIDRRDQGEFLQQLNQMETVTEGIAGYFSNFIISALGILFQTILLVTLYDMTLVGILLLVLLGNASLGILFSRRASERANRQSMVLGAITTSILDGLSDIRAIRIFGARQWVRRRFGKLLEESLELLRRLTALQVYGRSLADALNILSEAAIFILCGMRIFQGTYSLGDFLVFFTFARALNAESSRFPELILSFPIQLRAFARIQSILSLPRESRGARAIPPGPLEIEIRNLSFAYEKGQNVIQDLSLVLRQGATTAFVGESGSGKTTLMNLILGFYRPDSGQILVNGVDLNELDPEGYRAAVSAVFQDTILFNKTFFQNVSLGNEAVSRERVMGVAKKLGMEPLLEALPMGLDQLLFPGAISGGQTQQVGILRAMCKPFRLLIMDEATSALDSRTEERVVKGIQAHCGPGLTRAVIAHRLSTVKAADYIIAMKDGRVAEQGNHESLIRRKGYYLELVQRQYEVNLAPSVSNQ